LSNIEFVFYGCITSRKLFLPRADSAPVPAPAPAPGDNNPILRGDNGLFLSIYPILRTDSLLNGIVIPKLRGDAALFGNFIPNLSEGAASLGSSSFRFRGDGELATLKLLKLPNESYVTGFFFSK
jgi:hypothetical protein